MIVNQRPDLAVAPPAVPFRAPYSHHAAGMGLRALVVDDFNMDGNPDVAAAAWDDGAVDVLLGDRRVALLDSHAFPVGKHPGFIASGLIDGDTTPDLVTLDVDDQTISVLLGNRDGTFQTRLTSPTASNASGLALADFDGDGKLDLAYGDNADGAIVVLRGDGTGRFPTSVVTSVPAGAVMDSLRVMYFEEGDLIADLVVSFDLPGAVDTPGTPASLWHGVGDGTFKKAWDMWGRSGRHRASVSHGSLALVAELDNNEILYVSDSFDGPTNEELLPVPVPVAIAVADFDGDGQDDVATADADRSIAVALGSTLTQGGLFPPIAVPLGAIPSDLAAADMDHDGRVDLVVALPSEIGILFNGR